MKYTWLVEKYLEGELSGEALRKFELEILRKPEVAEEVERVRSMHRFMQEQHSKFMDSVGLIEDYEDSDNVIDEEIIRQDLEGLKVRRISADQRDIYDLQTKLTETKVSRTLAERQSNKVLVRKLSVWLAAASITVLLAVSALLLIGKSASADYMALYEQYYEPYQADITDRSPETMSDRPYQNALMLYDQANFEGAFQLFKDIPQNSPPELKYHLYMGITEMELGDFESAITSFAKLSADRSLYLEGRWYTGFAYLGMEDGESARTIFEEVVASDGFYYSKKAKKLLRSL